MVDLVGTCPKDFWWEWISEGDAAGSSETGQEYGWHTRHSLIRKIEPGDRFYVVAHGRLRGYAPVTDVTRGAIFREGNAVAVTIPEPIPGFRGLRERWWPRENEVPFPDWQTAGVVPDVEQANEPVPGGLFVHTTPDIEKCQNGEKHQFTGWRDFEDGNGGEQVCSQCGIGAMAWSLRVGP